MSDSHGKREGVVGCSATGSPHKHHQLLFPPGTIHRGTQRSSTVTQSRSSRKEPYSLHTMRSKAFPYATTKEKLNNHGTIEMFSQPELHQFSLHGARRSSAIARYGRVDLLSIPRRRFFGAAMQRRYEILQPARSDPLLVWIVFD